MKDNNIVSYIEERLDSLKDIKQVYPNGSEALRELEIEERVLQDLLDLTSNLCKLPRFINQPQYVKV